MKSYFVLFTVITFLALFSAFDFNNSGNEFNKIIDIVPCELLTSEQVETVLPGHDEGYTALSGGSLMKGVDSYQCSYANEKTDILTVIVHVAADKDKFDWIKPQPSSSETEIKIGDGGWLSSEPNELRLEASKGLKVIELNLMADDAQTKTDALIKLASILIDKI
ncbi:MAG TPA: hypothetical protein VLB50_03960 [Ignavibacteriaceae bacterium]|nr:hypothetical protein [Ignavibacteriaceae bacterium]